ncbi:MAG: hypothetical protein KDA32_06295 [Phycisphaerales bacterium]|nr:hypothetical protein [Phycisphaerales bacterium]
MLIAESNPEALMSTALRLTLIGVVTLVVGTVIVLAIRKRLQRSAPLDDVFTLSDLRAMRARGELDESEYAALREATLGRFAASGEPAEPKPPTPDPDWDR